MGESTCVVQVTNVAPAATLEQMETLFQHLGQIDSIAMYPNDTDETTNNTQSKVCFVKYKESSSVLVAQHLTNTVFIDRALIVQPHAGNQIPDASNANTLTSGTPFNGGSNSGLMSQIVAGVGGAQVISTIDPRLAALGLPQYPPLPANTDPGKVEEIRRTIYVGNLDSKITAEETLKFFNQIGEVKYVRMAGDETQPTRFAFVEFTEQSSVANALQYNGVTFGGRPLKINHSNNAIVKPQAKSAETAQKEIEEAMKRVREAQNQIKAQIDTQSNSRSGSNDKSPSRKDAFNDSSDRRSGRDRTRSRSKSRERTARTSPTRSSKSRSSRHKERERERPRSRSRERTSRYERERSRERTSRERESRRHPRSPRRRSRSSERTRPERRSRERSPISLSSRRIIRSKSRERRSRSREKDHRTSRSSRSERNYSSKDISRSETSRRDYRRH